MHFWSCGFTSVFLSLPYDQSRHRSTSYLPAIISAAVLPAICQPPFCQPLSVLPAVLPACVTTCVCRRQQPLFPTSCPTAMPSRRPHYAPYGSDRVSDPIEDSLNEYEELVKEKRLLDYVRRSSTMCMIDEEDVLLYYQRVLCPQQTLTGLATSLHRQVQQGVLARIPPSGPCGVVSQVYCHAPRPAIQNVLRLPGSLRGG